VRQPRACAAGSTYLDGIEERGLIQRGKHSIKAHYNIIGIRVQFLHSSRIVIFVMLTVGNHPFQSRSWKVGYLSGGRTLPLT